MRIRTRQMTFGRYPTEEPDANLYILWGHNPDQSDFPLKFMMKRNLKKGAKLVVIDPKRIPMADQADMYMRIRPGTDGALALAMMNVIIAEDLYDHDFIEKHTTGFDKLVPHVKPYTPEWAEVPKGPVSFRAPAHRIRQPMAPRTAVPLLFSKPSRATSTCRAAG
jgi:anaerobic selenocysteine-containing dehydrogenase